MRVNSGFRFIPESLAESTELLPRPGCGFYCLYSFAVENAPDEEKLWFPPEQTIALVVVNIAAYRGRLLDDTALEHLRQILRIFRKRERDVILRVVYDSDGHGMEHEPSQFHWIEDHIRQLLPVLMAEPVFIFQGFLLGSWGEMHSSRYLTETHLRRLYALLEPLTGCGTYLAVRRPMFHRMLCGPGQDSRIGLYDDAIFGSETHLGTFASQPSSNWTDAWLPKKELAFEESLCTRVPQGGEVVLGQEKHVGVLDKLRKMRISYLNREHDKRLLTQWEQQRHHSRDCWNEVSTLHYIRCHLGYRFVVESAKVTDGQLRLQIRNTGFAPCYQEMKLTLLQKAGSEITEIPIPADTRTWLPMHQITVICPAPQTECELYLRLRRTSDGRAVPFGNKEYKNDVLFLGRNHPPLKEGHRLWKR